MFWRIHNRLPKQGPGSDPSTRRALSLVRTLPERPRILDLGCGPGRQSLLLARETGGDVTAIDLLPPFLEQLQESAREAGLDHRIHTRQASMSELDDEDESFDLVWSEGAIYNIGFSHGLGLWRRLIRPGASVAVSEATWLRNDAPDKIRTYWQQHYPGMRDQSANEVAVERAGYRLTDSFVLPENEWWDDYYTLIESRLDTLRGERNDASWQAAISHFDEELEIVREGLGFFGYVFYVMEKTET